MFEHHLSLRFLLVTETFRAIADRYSPGFVKPARIIVTPIIEKVESLQTTVTSEIHAVPSSPIRWELQPIDARPSLRALQDFYVKDPAFDANLTATRSRATRLLVGNYRSDRAARSAYARVDACPILDVGRKRLLVEKSRNRNVREEITAR